MVCTASLFLQQHQWWVFRYGLQVFCPAVPLWFSSAHPVIQRWRFLMPSVNVWSVSGGKRSLSLHVPPKRKSWVGWVKHAQELFSFVGKFEPRWFSLKKGFCYLYVKYCELGKVERQAQQSMGHTVWMSTFLVWVRYLPLFRSNSLSHAQSLSFLFAGSKRTKTCWGERRGVRIGVGTISEHSP